MSLKCARVLLGLAVALAQSATPAPVVRLTTYLGGSNADSGRQIAVDPAGNLYVIGSTISTNFPNAQSPISMGPAQRRSCSLSAAFTYDCTRPTGFVAKLNSTASSIAYAAYYSGDGQISGMAVDAAGSVYLAGVVASPVFKPTPGAYNTTPPPSGPAPFLVKLSPDGNSIVFATYLDGPPAGIAVDGFGNAIVAGTVARPGKGNDAYVLRLNPTGTAPLSMAYVGGGKDESATAMTLAPDGRVLLLGQTMSQDFPLTIGPAPASLSGSNSFVVRLNIAGTAVSDAALLAATGGDPTAAAIAADPAGNIYTTGSNSGDVFAVKLNAVDLKLGYFITVGGSGTESGEAIAVDAFGRAYITGTTNSSDFPVTPDAFQRAPGGGTKRLIDGLSGGPTFDSATDAFVIQLSGAGALLYASYLGGTGDDAGHGIVIDAANNAYVTGSSRSDDLRFTPGTMQLDRAAGTCDTLIDVFGRPRPVDQFYPCEDVFITKIDFSATSAVAPQVVNGASFTNLPLATGTIVSVIGAGLGPISGVQQTLGSDGRFGTALAGSSVMFDGIPAPILYAQDKQLNVVVPWSVSGPRTAVKVQYNGVTQDAGLWPVAAVAPAIFALDPAGRGQGAILNQDGTVNGPSNPAARGSVIQIFATGGGATNPRAADGAVTAPPFPGISAPVGVWFSSIHNNPLTRAFSSGQVTYSGAAPALIAGAVQVNAIVPSDADVGPAVPLFLEIGAVDSQMNITVAIK